MEMAVKPITLDELVGQVKDPIHIARVGSDVALCGAPISGWAECNAGQRDDICDTCAGIARHLVATGQGRF